MSNKQYTITGTDIEQVKQLNASSGLSYNEVKARLANSGSYSMRKDSKTNHRSEL